MITSNLTFQLANPPKLTKAKKSNFPSTIETGFKRQFEIEPIHGNRTFETQVASCQQKSEYFQIIYLTQGSCVCHFGLDNYTISSRNLGFIRPAQSAQLMFCSDAHGYILRFTTQYLNTSIEKSASLNPATWIGFDSLSILSLTESGNKEINFILGSIAKQHCSLGTGSDMFGPELISSLVKVFLVYLSRFLTERSGFKKSAKTSLIERFFVLLESSYKIFKSPSDYADTLEISSGYLNEMLKKTCGFTTSYYISQRTITEAKRLIIYSDTSMKAIAYELGFDDMSHFSKLFKRVSGESFTTYRRKASQRIQGFCDQAL